jgi:UPF0755 protein
MLGLLLALAACGGVLGWWLNNPLVLSKPAIEFEVEPGQTPRDLVRNLTEAGVQASPFWLYQWFRWSGDARSIRAGSYEIAEGVTPRSLLRKLVVGDESLALFRLIDG